MCHSLGAGRLAVAEPLLVLGLPIPCTPELCGQFLYLVVPQGNGEGEVVTEYLLCGCLLILSWHMPDSLQSPTPKSEPQVSQ